MMRIALLSIAAVFAVSAGHFVSPASAQDCKIGCNKQRAAGFTAARQTAKACRQQCRASTSGADLRSCVRTCVQAFHTARADGRSQHTSCQATCKLPIPVDGSCLASCGRDLASCALPIIDAAKPCLQGCLTAADPLACVNGCAAAARDGAEACAATFTDCVGTCVPQPTPTPSPAPGGPVCNASGKAVIKAVVPGYGTLSVNVALSGSQEWVFGDPDADGVRPITLPASGSHFDCAQATAAGQTASVCTRIDPRVTAGGSIDCNGGNLTGYNSTFQTDHRNPAVQTIQSGAFPPGGVVLTEPLLLRPVIGSGCSANPCPADDAPYDSASDVALSGSITSGTATAIVLNAGNVTGQTLQTSVSGNPFSCANAIDNNDLSQGALAAAYPLANETVQGISADVVASLVITCQ